MPLEQIRNIIKTILQKHGAEFVGIFGSVARGEAGPESDIDVLVRFNRDISLLDHIGFAQELEDMLDKKVDLITESSLSAHVIQSVKKDLTPLYGQVQRPDLL